MDEKDRIIASTPSADASGLRQLSPITFALERIFYYLQYASPANILFSTRLKQATNFDDENIWALTTQRSRRIETYIAFWFVLEVSSIALSKHKQFNINSIVAYIAAFRIFEILQAGANMHVFDRLRIRNRPHYVATIARTLVLSVWNYIELILCFGVIYSSRLDSLANAQSWVDAYYFSVVTQLTIGYGDMFPKNGLKAVVAVQGISAFLFGLVVLSRFVAFLPRTESVLRDDS